MGLREGARSRPGPEARGREASPGRSRPVGAVARRRGRERERRQGSGVPCRGVRLEAAHPPPPRSGASSSSRRRSRSPKQVRLLPPRAAPALVPSAQVCSRRSPPRRARPLVPPAVAPPTAGRASVRTLTSARPGADSDDVFTEGAGREVSVSVSVPAAGEGEVHSRRPPETSRVLFRSEGGNGDGRRGEGPALSLGEASPPLVRPHAMDSVPATVPSVPASPGPSELLEPLSVLYAALLARLLEVTPRSREGPQPRQAGGRTSSDWSGRPERRLAGRGGDGVRGAEAGGAPRGCSRRPGGGCEEVSSRPHFSMEPFLIEHRQRRFPLATITPAATVTPPRPFLLR